MLVYLYRLSGITTQLQSTTIDIIEAHYMVGGLLVIYVLYIFNFNLYRSGPKPFDVFLSVKRMSRENCDITINMKDLLP